MSEIGREISQEPAAPVKATEQNPEGWLNRVKRIITFSGSVAKEAEDPNRVNPFSKIPPVQEPPVASQASEKV